MQCCPIKQNGMFNSRHFHSNFQNICVASSEKGIMVDLYVILFICR